MIGICHRAAHVSYLLSDLAAVPVRACEQVSELELQGWGWLAQRLSRVFDAVQSLDRNSADKGSLRRYNSSHEAHSLAPPPAFSQWQHVGLLGFKIRILFNFYFRE